MSCSSRNTERVATDAPVRIAPRYELHRTACGFVVFDMSSLKPVMTLNEPGALLWSLCRESMRPVDVVDLVCSELDAGRGDVAQQVAEFLAHLDAHGVLAPRQPDTGEGARPPART